MIAFEIMNLWPKVNYAAVPYLEAMHSLREIDDSYGADPAREIVLKFLGNAKTWRGPVARRVKAELNALLKG